MGAVKGMVMDLEETFYDTVDESAVSNAECYQEFLDTCLNNATLLAKMSASDIRSVASFVWNEYWSEYAY